MVRPIAHFKELTMITEKEPKTKEKSSAMSIIQIDKIVPNSDGVGHK